MAGSLFSIDRIAYNPVIKVYRRVATQTRTTDELSLTVKDLRLAERHFQECSPHRQTLWRLCAIAKTVRDNHHQVVIAV